MAEHLVCLSFDFDAMSGFVARGMNTPTPVSRGEFGAVGVERILLLLQKHQIQASWFIPGVVIGTYPQLCARIVEEGHEIGHHGWTHATPASMTREQEREALLRGNDAIEKLSGRLARGYRSPSWDLSPHTIELLLEQDFFYESSMMGHDYVPYRARTGDRVHEHEAMEFGTPTPLIEMPISWTLDDYPHFEFVVNSRGIMPGLQNANNVLSNWLDDFRYMNRIQEWGVITYTCHPLVIGRGHRMMMLERLIETLKAEGATFVSMEAAAKAYAQRAD